MYNVNHGSNSWPMMRRYVIPMNVEHSCLKNSGGNSPTMPMAITCSRQKCSNLPDQGSAHEKVSFSVLSKLIRHRKTKPARVHVPVARNAASNTFPEKQYPPVHEVSLSKQGIQETLAPAEATITQHTNTSGDAHIFNSTKCKTVNTNPLKRRR